MKWTSLRGRDGVWGGDLVDVSSPFAMRDKLSHFLGGGYVYLLAARWTRLDALPCLGIVLGCAVLVEVVEEIRYRKYGWTRNLSDEADGTDVLVTVAGGVFGWLVL